MRVHIVGGTGFVGKALVDFAHSVGGQSGVEVSISSRNRPVPDLGVEWFQWDVMEDSPRLPDFDGVIHAATPVSVEMNAAQPGRMYGEIVEGAMNVAKLCASQRKRPHLVYLSSGAVYGEMPPNTFAWREDAALNFDPFGRGNAYALGKISAEALLSIRSIESKFPLTIARLFAFSGPHLPVDKHFAVGNFVRDAMSGGPIKVRGSGRAIRSYLDSRDMAQWLFAALDRSSAYGKIIHVGSSKGLTIGDLASEISRLSIDFLGSAAEVVVENRVSEFDGLQRYVPSTKATERLLGVSAKVNLEDSLLAMMHARLSPDQC